MWEICPKIISSQGEEIGVDSEIGHNGASRSENVQKISHGRGNSRSYDEKNGHKEEKSRKYIQNHEKSRDKW